MFTGLVQRIGTVRSIDPQDDGHRLVIDPGDWPGNDHPDGYLIRMGDSISVAGVCLTVAELDGGLLHFDAVPETLSKTTLGRLTPGSRVNLEPGLLPTRPMGGHVVQGHVDTTAEVIASGDRGDAGWQLVIRAPDSLQPYIVPRGSIAVEGVSLTLAGVDHGAGTFTLALIPVTLEHTTLGGLKPGDRVNLEADVLTKAVVQRVDQVQGSKAKELTMSDLAEAGWDVE